MGIIPSKDTIVPRKKQEAYIALVAALGQILKAQASYSAMSSDIHMRMCYERLLIGDMALNEMKIHSTKQQHIELLYECLFDAKCASMGLKKALEGAPRHGRIMAASNKISTILQKIKTI